MSGVNEIRPVMKTQLSLKSKHFIKFGQTAQSPIRNIGKDHHRIIRQRKLQNNQIFFRYVEHYI